MKSIKNKTKTFGFQSFVDFRATDCINGTEFTKAVKIHEQAHTGGLRKQLHEENKLQQRTKGSSFLKNVKQTRVSNFY